VLSGVPQGSVLGPLLFLLYVNELPECIKCDMKMFADNTKIWCKITKDKDSCILQGETDDSRKVRFTHARETSIELRESSPILRESSDDPKST